MADGHQVDSSWMWHPSFTEDRKDTAGLIVHFRRSLDIASSQDLPSSLRINITADTRYKLYVNRDLTAFGPVKGDPALWFEDEVDVAPHLQVGHNSIYVSVLRFFHATDYASSFPRMPVGGLRVTLPVASSHWEKALGSSSLWETAIDSSITLRVDEPEDDFLHVYEKVIPSNDQDWTWRPAEAHEFQISTGNAPPWSISPRMIPQMSRKKDAFSAIHNLSSSIEATAWEASLLSSSTGQKVEPLRLAAGSKHQLDLEMSCHVTAFIQFLFSRSESNDSVLNITYSESYEAQPTLVPYLRRKGDRRDFGQELYGPSDIYHFQGTGSHTPDMSEGRENDAEVYAPYHFRTFRFVRLAFQVGSTDLIFRGIDVEKVTYPLDVTAKISSSQLDTQLWDTSVRTLHNCMHDCYEDCPFYEQLQYAMDTRSSSLFTYRLTGDDRLSRQAIIQLHNSFQPRLGLTSSRAPAHKSQVIPNFSLFWICMIADHFEYFGDAAFVSTFAPVMDAVLNYFQSRIQPNGLIQSDFVPGVWNFVDWAKEWRPYGIPAAAERTGFSTYTNQLYAYTLRHAAVVASASGRVAVAQEYLQRADRTLVALLEHCFDGEMFADTLVSDANPYTDYSQMCQAWAVLSGAVRGIDAQMLLRKALEPASSSQRPIVRASTAMSFYTLRALSQAGGNVYDDYFHDFWAPWKAQLALNVTTWEEDDVSQRSDCHAWGCSPLYEFTAEIAGVRPSQPGWAAIDFRPRLSLYPNFEASCPLRLSGEKVIGVAHVKWTTNEQSDIKVTLRFDMASPRIIPVSVKLPMQDEKLVDTTCETVLWVRGSDEGYKSDETPSWDVIDTENEVAK